MTTPNTARVLGFDDRNVHIDDLKCILNPMQAIDLKQILLMTPEDLRFDIACIFARVTKHQAYIQAGLANERDSSSNQMWHRWKNGHTKMPLGAAFRLARIFGVPADILLIHFARGTRGEADIDITWEEEA